MNEQLLKTSGADVLSSRITTEKNLMGEESGIHSLPPPTPLYIRGLTCKNRTIVKNDFFCLRRWKFVNQLSIELKL